MVTRLSSDALCPVYWNLAPIFLLTYFMVNTLILPQIIVGKVVTVLLKNWRKDLGGMRYIESFYSSFTTIYVPFCGVWLNFINYFSVVDTIRHWIILLLFLFANRYRPSTFDEVSCSPLILSTNHTCYCFWVMLVQVYFIEFSIWFCILCSYFTINVLKILSFHYFDLIHYRDWLYSILIRIKWTKLYGKDGIKIPSLQSHVREIA